jgi:hypothetical protein
MTIFDSAVRFYYLRLMNQRKIALVIFCGLILIPIAIIIISFSDSDENYSAPLYIPLPMDAYVASMKLVKNELKAPSTAKFASYQDSKISKIDLDEWQVSSFVDSQNSFGAMIRTRYTIVIHVDPYARTWQKISFIAE